ncbi:hypothetical protein [Amycolatopsis samaneae]|uniref:Uncharacterized protein n=1 Tax=Amycolatopsis samaneae TaxID=664691 RepID=A0ABW5GR64_9PSEU
MGIDGGVIDLYERPGVPVLGGDRTGRARLIGCGAVLANLEVAVRVLGWVPRTGFGGTPAEPDRVARIVSGTRAAPTARDRARYCAVFGRAIESEVDRLWLSDRLVRRLRPWLQGSGVYIRALREERAETRMRRRCLPVGGDGRSCDCVAVAVDTETRSQLVKVGRVAQYLLLAAAELGVEGRLETKPFAYPGTRAEKAAALGMPGLAELLVTIAIPDGVRGPVDGPVRPAA